MSNSRGRVVFVDGEAGIGKTALVEHFGPRRLFGNLVAGIAVGGPLVLVIEDAHRADDGTIDLIAMPAGGPSTCRWAWMANPTGDFEDWNPAVVCPYTEGHTH